jgi:hypothetical protein
MEEQASDATAEDLYTKAKASRFHLNPAPNVAQSGTNAKAKTKAPTTILQGDTGRIATVKSAAATAIQDANTSTSIVPLTRTVTPRLHEMAHTTTLTIVIANHCSII